MRRLLFLIVVTLLIAAPALAQSGRVLIDDPDGVLGADAARVEQAARPLADAGAEVIIVAAGPSAGTTEESAETYLRAYLARNNLAPSQDQLRPNQIVVFVATVAQRTSLRYGQRWIEQLDPVEARIQAQQMNPRFAEGDIAGGLIAGIDAINATINPPPPDRTWLYVLGGVLALGMLAMIATPVIRRRRAAADALAAARERWETARRNAGAAIADLGRLAQTAQEKAAYDRLSYGAADAAQVQTIHAAGMERFEQAQAAFRAAEEHARQSPPSSATAYDASAAQYAQAQRLAEQAAAKIREAESLRARLDARGTPSTGPTTRLGDDPPA